MRLHDTKGATSDESRDPAITEIRTSVLRLRILTASLFALMIVLNLTPAAAEIKAKITGEDVVDGSLTGADIQDRSLSGVDVASGSIDGFNIALDTLVGGHVVDDSLSTLDMQNGSLTGADVQDSSLTGVDIQNSSLTGFDVSDGSLTGDDVLQGSITGFEVANGSLTVDDIDESTLSNDAHDFFNAQCDPHSETFIHCGTVSFTLGNDMPVIAFWNYGYGSEIEGDMAWGSCQTRIDGATTGEVTNETYEDKPGPFSTNGHYGATPIVDVLQLSGGTHTVSLWCSEIAPDDRDFVVFDLRMAVVELGLD